MLFRWHPKDVTTYFVEREEMKNICKINTNQNFMILDKGSLRWKTLLGIKQVWHTQKISYQIFNLSISWLVELQFCWRQQWAHLKIFNFLDSFAARDDCDYFWLRMYRWKSTAWYFWGGYSFPDIKEWS